MDKKKARLSWKQRIIHWKNFQCFLPRFIKEIQAKTIIQCLELSIFIEFTVIIKRHFIKKYLFLKIKFYKKIN